jgi:hypothetical protein
VLRLNPEEISRILATANEAGIGIVPQAGNTGLVGGQIPSLSGTEIVLSVSRLNRVRKIDAGAMVVEAGLTLTEAQAIAERAGRLFPLSLPSEGSCQIGGALATNAGGVGVLAYGSARNLALGLEVLCRRADMGRSQSLKKDNSGQIWRPVHRLEGTSASSRRRPCCSQPAESDVVGFRHASALALFRLAEERRMRAPASASRPPSTSSCVTSPMRGCRSSGRPPGTC